MEDAPDAASAAVSNILSVVCPAADCVFGDTMGDVFDAVAEVALGALGAFWVTLGSLARYLCGALWITLGSLARCLC